MIFFLNDGFKSAYEIGLKKKILVKTIKTCFFFFFKVEGLTNTCKSGVLISNLPKKTIYYYYYYYLYIYIYIYKTENSASTTIFHVSIILKIYKNTKTQIFFFSKTR